ncbi:metal-dependent phosphoesterase [Paraoerskovia sediminicola]|uniref:Metal-dependent phosphoesterase n=1 Tax=Paraoerskovia sediminicola TaxID=1138587 RepID=A0ABM8FZ14_9CELL|nr:metal-dependent phosphoesterase [Paraoerskovia sediminicola]
MLIDLHTHSTASDGTEAPAEVVASAARAGVDVLALTDHDTTAGWDEAGVAAARLGVALVRGTEVSAQHRGSSLHVLSYLQDPTAPALLREMELARDSRETRARRMVELIAVDHPITWEDVLAQTVAGTTIGRPHIADALVAAGHFPDRSAAFTDVLRSGGRYHVHHYAPSAVDAVLAIRESGGVPVFAHPGAEVKGPVVDDAVIRAMADAGLAGLEVFHRDHSDAQRARLHGLADELGLFVTGSSDYHGTGKPNLLGRTPRRPPSWRRSRSTGPCPCSAEGRRWTSRPCSTSGSSPRSS